MTARSRNPRPSVRGGSQDQALAERAAALHRWVDAGGSMYRAGQITGMSAGAVRNALGLRQLPGRITRS